MLVSLRSGADFSTGVCALGNATAYFCDPPPSIRELTPARASHSKGEQGNTKGSRLFRPDPATRQCLLRGLRQEVEMLVARATEGYQVLQPFHSTVSITCCALGKNSSKPWGDDSTIMVTVSPFTSSNTMKRIFSPFSTPEVSPWLSWKRGRSTHPGHKGVSTAPVTIASNRTPFSPPTLVGSGSSGLRCGLARSQATMSSGWGAIFTLSDPFGS